MTFWAQIDEEHLAQGDLLPRCLIPSFDPDYGRDGPDAVREVPVAEADLIIVTQSCDLANDKVSLVALCPIHTLAAWEGGNPKFKQKGRWEDVRKGKFEGLHMLGSPEQPDINTAARVVDFGQIFSLPPKYLRRHAQQLGHRWRLNSPYLEHFSQAFARYFMRVGLPSSIESFK